MKGLTRGVALLLMYLGAPVTCAMAASGSIQVNTTSGGTANNDYTSSAITVPPDTTEVTVAVHFSSVHGDTVPGYSLYRQVSWRIGYSSGNGSFAFITPYKTVQIGASTGYVNDSMTTSLPWQPSPSYIEVEYSAGDVAGGGTFSVPLKYSYSSASESNGNTVEAYELQYGRSFLDASDPIPPMETYTNTLPLSAYSPPSGWEVYRVDYNYGMAYATSTGVTGDWAAAYGPPNEIPYSGSSGDINKLQPYSFHTSSYDPNVFTIKASVQAAGIGDYSTSISIAVADIKIGNGSATISIRKPKADSSTTNNFVFDSVNYETDDLSWLPSVLMQIMD